MNVNIQAIHFEASTRLNEFINKKAERLARHFPDIANLDFTLKVVKPETAMNKHVIVKATVPQTGELVADKTADTFEEAIDVALEAIEKQLEKQKVR